MNNNLYTEGNYIKKNHSYHTEDSKYKWNNFSEILKSSNFNFNSINSIVDIGCGGGQILIEAKNSNLFKNDCQFEGYDINPDAIELAKKNFTKVSFFNKDFINLDIKNKDMIIAADVFEHVQNTYDFLNRLREKGNFFLFNIPLEISFLSMIRKKNVFKHSFNNVGHLHFYTLRTSILLLENTGFKIVNYKLVNNRLKDLRENKKLKSFIICIPQLILQIINKNLASSFFGGYSLVVLAKKV